MANKLYIYLFIYLKCIVFERLFCLKIKWNKSDAFVFQEIDWKNEWHPKIVFFNALEPFEKFQKDHDVYFDDEDGMVYAIEKYRIKGTFRENLELWDFPLDFQVSFTMKIRKR